MHTYPRRNSLSGSCRSPPALDYGSCDSPHPGVPSLRRDPLRVVPDGLKPRIMSAMDIRALCVAQCPHFLVPVQKFPQNKDKLR